MAEERVQRRLAAILAADVAGYSRPMEADEEGTRTRLRSLRAELISVCSRSIWKISTGPPQGRPAGAMNFQKLRVRKPIDFRIPITPASFS